MSLKSITDSLLDYTDYTFTLPERPDEKLVIKCRRLNARESGRVTMMAMRALPPLKQAPAQTPTTPPMPAAGPGGATPAGEPVFDISNPKYLETKARYELISRGMALWYTVQDIKDLIGIHEEPATEDGWAAIADAIAVRFPEDLMLHIFIYVSRGLDQRYSDFFSVPPSPGG